MENVVTYLIMLTVLMQVLILRQKSHLLRPQVIGRLQQGFPVNLDLWSRNFYSYGDFIHREVENEIDLDQHKQESLFRKVLKVKPLSPHDKETKKELLNPNRILHNLLFYDLGNYTEMIPEKSPNTGATWTYFVEMNESRPYDFQEIINNLGGTKIVWDKHTFTLQEIEEICLEEDLVEVNNYQFFFQGISLSTKRPKLMIMTVMKEKENTFFFLKSINDANPINKNVLLLKKLPEPDKFTSVH